MRAVGSLTIIQIYGEMLPLTFKTLHYEAYIKQSFDYIIATHVVGSEKDGYFAFMDGAYTRAYSNKDCKRMPLKGWIHQLGPNDQYNYNMKPLLNTDAAVMTVCGMLSYNYWDKYVNIYGSK